jgi:hypothetical protein
MLNIVELLTLRGLDINSKIILVRHQDKRYDVNELLKNGQLEIYQSYQSKPIFECDYIVSFIGIEGTRARFMGVYKVLGRKPSKDVPLPEKFLYKEFASKDDYYYVLEEVRAFDDLKWRVIIDWGKATLAWHQKLSEKEVIEILPTGYVKQFPGFLNFVLQYDELVEIINNPDANREWHRMLSSVAGVYLITDLVTGMQYVGSAYGKEGILGRWAVYARSPDGGNVQLEKLLEKDRSYAKNFQFTILQALPQTLPSGEVINYEHFYMKKLGSRAFGFNSKKTIL